MDMSEQLFEPVPASKGASVSITVNDEERTLKAKKGKGGWYITPTDEFEAMALEKLSPEALNPQSPPDQPDQGDDAEDQGNEPDSAEGTTEPPSTFAAANAEANEGQEES
jgi:hypothetical protein